MMHHLIVLLVVALLAPSVTHSQGSTDRNELTAWTNLPESVAVEPITTGTYDDLLNISRLIAISRTSTRAGSGFLSFYNTYSGFVGPRIIYAPLGDIEVGPVDVSPGSSPGPSMLFGVSNSSPQIVMPGSQLPLAEGDYMYFPADTSFRLTSLGSLGTTYFELDIFPAGFQLTQPNQEGVSGFISNPVIPDIGVDAIGVSPVDFVSIDRLTLSLEQGAFTHETAASPQILLIQSGTLAVIETNNKLQVLRSGEKPPGSFATQVNPILGANDAIFFPPGTEVEVAPDPTELTIILAVTINPAPGN